MIRDRLALTFLIVGIILGGAIWVSTWIDPHEGEQCLESLPTGPALDYIGSTGEWMYNGAVIGWSPTEDAECITPK